MAESEGTSEARYAVYDHTLLRYVTGVYASKAAAEGALEKVKGHKYETRTV